MGLRSSGRASDSRTLSRPRPKTCHPNPALQYSRARCAARGRLQAPSPRSLRVGSHRPDRDRASSARRRSGSLLAQHPLEPALNVGRTDKDDQPATSKLQPPLVVILGPTASGKTALSLALAEKFNGEIVNCDSVAMYREFDIGTAKPTAEERSRAPHHLFDCVEPTNYMTAGEYARQARQVLAEISQRQHLPIVVGGTGLYLRALLEGLFPGP